jgi:BlaI family transcriptional regulator, penicillinase repressor
MPRKNRSHPTDAQLVILSLLWELGPATVREVHEALTPEQRRGYTTTLKLMQIMAEQGLVKRDESKRSHVYTAAVGERETKTTLVDELLDKAFGGSAAELVLRALSDRPSTPEELAEIREMLDQLEKGSAS